MTFLELFNAPVTITRDIPYLDDGHPRHRLDVYAPEGAIGLPVTLWFYGGGWRSGDKRLFDHIGRAFAVRGIVTVAVNYRLTPEATHPDHVRDCSAALEWTYRNIAEYGGDANRIFLSGHSAGAHLASLLALDPQYRKERDLPDDVVKGVVAVSGATDLNAHVESTKFTSREHIEQAFGDEEHELADASPLTHAIDRSIDPPPFMIIVAEHDPEGLRAQAKALSEALRDVDGAARFVSVNGRDHFTIVRRFGPDDDAAANAAGEFINAVAGRLAAGNVRS